MMIKCPKTEPAIGFRPGVARWECRREFGHTGPCAAELVRAGVVIDVPRREGPPTEIRTDAPWCKAEFATAEGAPNIRCNLVPGHAGLHGFMFGEQA